MEKQHYTNGGGFMKNDRFFKITSVIIPLFSLTLTSCVRDPDIKCPNMRQIGYMPVNGTEIPYVPYYGIDADIADVLDDVPEAEFATRTISIKFGFHDGKPNPILSYASKYRVFWAFDYLTGVFNVGVAFQNKSVISMKTQYEDLDGNQADYPSFERFFYVDHDQENEFYEPQLGLHGEEDDRCSPMPLPIKHKANMYVFKQKMWPSYDVPYVLQTPLIWDLEIDSIVDGCDGKLDKIIPTVTITMRYFNSYWGDNGAQVPTYQVFGRYRRYEKLLITGQNPTNKNLNYL